MCITIITIYYSLLLWLGLMIAVIEEKWEHQRFWWTNRSWQYSFLPTDGVKDFSPIITSILPKVPSSASTSASSSTSLVDWSRISNQNEWVIDKWSSSDLMDEEGWSYAAFFSHFQSSVFSVSPKARTS